MIGHLNQLQKANPHDPPSSSPPLPLIVLSLIWLNFPFPPSTYFPQIVLLRKNTGSPSGLSILGAGGGENFEVGSPLTLELAVPPL